MVLRDLGYSANDPWVSWGTRDSKLHSLIIRSRKFFSDWSSANTLYSFLTCLKWNHFYLVCTFSVFGLWCFDTFNAKSQFWPAELLQSKLWFHKKNVLYYGNIFRVPMPGHLLADFRQFMLRSGNVFAVHVLCFRLTSSCLIPSSFFDELRFRAVASEKQKLNHWAMIFETKKNFFF